MPLCPQITNTPITVVLNADFTVTSVIPVLAADTVQLAALDAEVVAADAAAAAAVVTANAAAAAAAAAQASAATAFATAVAAGTAASTAQTTADGKNKVVYSTSAPGSTPNAVGDVWFQYGTAAPNVGRIIAQFIGAGGTSWTQTTVSGLVIANIDAGSITTGTISVGLGITTGTGTFTVNALTGALFANSATIQGAVNATSGYFGTLTNGFSISSTGLVGVGAGTIVGGAISGTTFTNGSTFSVTSAGALTATSGVVGGTTLGVSSLTGGLIQTSSGAASVSLVGSNNSLTFKTASANSGYILPLNTGSGSPAYGLLLHYPTVSGSNPTGAADPTGGTFPQMFVGSGNLSMFANTSNGIGVGTSTGIQITGTTSLNNQTNYPGVATGAGTAMVLVSTGSRVAIVTSSERFKEQIAYINTTGWLDKVMQMKPITYKTSVDFTTPGEPNETQIGFLAEDIYDIGGDLEKAVVLDPLGEPFSLSYDRLTVFLTLAIKELKAEIDTLKGA